MTLFRILATAMLLACAALDLAGHAPTGFSAAIFPLAFIPVIWSKS